MSHDTYSDKQCHMTHTATYNVCSKTPHLHNQHFIELIKGEALSHDSIHNQNPTYWTRTNYLFLNVIHKYFHVICKYKDFFSFSNMANIDLKGFLECAICLDVYVKPKDLVCRHTFCKGCVDNILQFNEDGSAIINCPKKCKEQTFIDTVGTTNDLGTNFRFKSIVDEYNTKNRK